MKLIFQSSPHVTIGTNIFFKVPVILKYEETPLIEVINEPGIGFTTQIPIYHSDGTYLATVKGNRVYPNKDGEKAKIKIRDLESKSICTLGKKVLFELTKGVGNAFKADVELYTPDGHFIKCTDAPKPELFDLSGNVIKVGGITIIGNIFRNLAIGIWLRKNGSCLIAVR